MRAPKKVYYVEVKGRSGVRYAERGGGLFSRLVHAAARGRRSTTNSGSFKLYEGTVEWREIEAPPGGRYAE